MTQPLRQFLVDAIDLNDRDLESKNVGGNPETWQSGMFTFVRIAKSHPQLKTLSAYEAAQIIGRELKAAGVQVDAVFDSVDPLAELVATWDRVYPIDGGPLSLAWLLACRKPVTPIKSISKKYTAFVSIAYHLQAKRGSAAILLPVAKLAKMLGLDFRTISFYRKIAENEGLIEPVTKYRYTEKRAAEFFFRMRLFDSLTLNQVSHWNQDKQDLQDFQDPQDSQEKHEVQEEQEFPASRETSVPFRPSDAELERLKLKAQETASKFSAGGVQ